MPTSSPSSSSSTSALDPLICAELPPWQAAVRWLPKRGLTAQEYEDAYSQRSSWSSATFQRRLAVADGATESSYAGVWARLLVKSYTLGRLRGETAAGFLLDAGALEPVWLQSVLKPDLPWFAEEKIRQGAAAAFLGVTVSCGVDRSDLGWSAVALGDACLAVVRDGALLQSFPLGSAAQFGSRPVLLSSRREKHSKLLTHVGTAGGACIGGDELFLMTDALAKWFLEQAECGHHPWTALSALAAEDPAAFYGWTTRLRESGELRNDDVTLVALRIP